MIRLGLRLTKMFCPFNFKFDGQLPEQQQSAVDQNSFRFKDGFNNLRKNNACKLAQLIYNLFKQESVKNIINTLNKQESLQYKKTYLQKLIQDEITYQEVDTFKQLLQHSQFQTLHEQLKNKVSDQDWIYQTYFETLYNKYSRNKVYLKEETQQSEPGLLATKKKRFGGHPLSQKKSVMNLTSILGEQKQKKYEMNFQGVDKFIRKLNIKDLVGTRLQGKNSPFILVQKGFKADVEPNNWLYIYNLPLKLTQELTNHLYAHIQKVTNSKILQKFQFSFENQYVKLKKKGLKIPSNISEAFQQESGFYQNKQVTQSNQKVLQQMQKRMIKKQRHSYSLIRLSTSEFKSNLLTPSIRAFGLCLKQNHFMIEEGCAKRSLHFSVFPKTASHNQSISFFERRLGKTFNFSQNDVKDKKKKFILRFNSVEQSINSMQQLNKSELKGLRLTCKHLQGALVKTQKGIFEMIDQF